MQIGLMGFAASLQLAQQESNGCQLRMFPLVAVPADWHYRFENPTSRSDDHHRPNIIRSHLPNQRSLQIPNVKRSQGIEHN